MSPCESVITGAMGFRWQQGHKEGCVQERAFELKFKEGAGALQADR